MLNLWLRPCLHSMWATFREFHYKTPTLASTSVPYVLLAPRHAQSTQNCAAPSPSVVQGRACIPVGFIAVTPQFVNKMVNKEQAAVAAPRRAHSQSFAWSTATPQT